MILSLNLIGLWVAHCSDPELCFSPSSFFSSWTNSVFHSFKVKTNTLISDVQSRLVFLSDIIYRAIYIYSETNRRLSLSRLLNLVPPGIYRARRMPSYTMLNIKMQRDSNSTPWGFRMQGRVFLLEPGKPLNSCASRRKRLLVSTTNSESQSEQFGWTVWNANEWLHRANWFSLHAASQTSGCAGRDQTAEQCSGIDLTTVSRRNKGKNSCTVMFSTISSGAPPDASDYNGYVEFPPHQLMDSMPNYSPTASQYRPSPPQPPTPQVYLDLTAIINTLIGVYRSVPSH